MSNAEGLVRGRGALRRDAVGDERWFEADGCRVRAWTRDVPHPLGHVVLVPGLGLPRYFGPLVRSLVARRLTTTLLDLPGFAAGRRDCVPHVGDVGSAVAAIVRANPPSVPLVLFGHSTGSLGALAAALDLQEGSRSIGLVMAGPVFDPAQRRWAPLIGATPWAYRQDPPSELLALVDATRAPARLVRLLRSGMRASPERDLAHLRLPLLLTAGQADAYAPPSWMATLAAAAAHSPAVRTVILPGSHNNPFTHAEDLAREVATEVSSLRRRGPRV